MKKGIAYLLLLMMLFMSGCGQKQPEPGTTAAPPETVAPETTEAETTVPETAPEPKLESAWVQGEGVPEVLSLLHRGDRVEVLSWIDETHAWVKAGEQEGSVEKQLLQMGNEESYVQWAGYSMYNAQCFANYFLTGQAETLPTNTKLDVLEELDSCYLVALEDGTTGFVSKTKVSRYMTGIGGGGNSSPAGGGSSGGSGGSGSSGGGGGQDGGDITLMVPGRLSLLADVRWTGDAVIKADGAELVLTTLSRGTELELIAEEGFAPDLEGYTTVYLGKEKGAAYVPEQWIRKQGEDAFEAWDGYAGYNCQLFDNIRLQGTAMKKIYTNSPVKVLWEAENVLLVQAGEELGYVAAETVRTTPIVAAPSGGDSGGSGGSGGGSGGSSGSGSGGEWTPPML